LLSCWRFAYLADRKARAELAGGEEFEGAEAGAEFGRGDAAFAEEPADEILAKTQRMPTRG